MHPKHTFYAVEQPSLFGYTCLHFPTIFKAPVPISSATKFFSWNNFLANLSTPRFSHLKILWVRSQHVPYGWHLDNFPKTAWIWAKVGSHLMSSIECFNNDFLVQRQRLHRFSGEWIEMTILSSSTFEETKFRGPHGSLMVSSEYLWVQDSRELHLDYMHDTSYSSSSLEACMSNLSTYSDSSWKTDSNEPNFINMQVFSIFSNMPCNVTHGSLGEMTFGNSRMRHVASLRGTMGQIFPSCG